MFMSPSHKEMAMKARGMFSRTTVCWWLGVLLAICGAAAGPGAGAVHAAVTVGEVSDGNATQGCDQFAFFGQALSDGTYDVPGPGVITKVAVKDLPVGSDFRAFALDVVAFREFKGITFADTYEVVGSTPAREVTSPGLFEANARIPVKGGETLGFVALNDIADGCFYGTANTAAGIVTGAFADPVDGAVVQAPLQGAGRLNLRATLEEDLDGDDFGDETQDSCPTIPTIHAGPCGVDVKPTILLTPSVVGPGQDAAVGVTVRATGSIAPVKASVAVAVPSGLTVTSMPSNCSQAGQTVTCTVQATPGGVGTLVGVHADQLGNYPLIATADPVDFGETDPADNQVQAVLRVEPTAGDGDPTGGDGSITNIDVTNLFPPGNSGGHTGGGGSANANAFGCASLISIKGAGLGRPVKVGRTAGSLRLVGPPGAVLGPGSFRFTLAGARALAPAGVKKVLFLLDGRRVHTARIARRARRAILPGPVIDGRSLAAGAHALRARIVRRGGSAVTARLRVMVTPCEPPSLSFSLSNNKPTIGYTDVRVRATSGGRALRTVDVRLPARTKVYTRARYAKGIVGEIRLTTATGASRLPVRVKRRGRRLTFKQTSGVSISLLARDSKLVRITGLPADTRGVELRLRGARKRFIAVRRGCGSHKIRATLTTVNGERGVVEAFRPNRCRRR
jgi:hypothetical protein